MKQHGNWWSCWMWRPIGINIQVLFLKIVLCFEASEDRNGTVTVKKTSTCNVFAVNVNVSKQPCHVEVENLNFEGVNTTYALSIYMYYCFFLYINDSSFLTNFGSSFKFESTLDVLSSYLSLLVDHRSPRALVSRYMQYSKLNLFRISVFTVLLCTVVYSNFL